MTNQTSYPRHRLSGRHLGPAVAVLLTTGVLAGCGGSSGTSSPGESSAPSATSSSSTVPSSTAPTSAGAPTPTASASDPTSSTAATNAPATGQTVSLSSLTFHVPQGWKLAEQTRVGTTGFDPNDDDGIGSVIVIDQSAFGAETINSEARFALMSAKSAGVKATRGPDLTINGVEGYVVSGSGGAYGVYYVFGTVTNQHDVSLLFQYNGKPADAQTTIASVLASITWT